MYKSSLLYVLSALLCLQQGSAGVIHTTDGPSSIGKAVEISHADTVLGLGNSAGSLISNGPSTTNVLNNAAKAKLMRREDPPDLRKLDELATWLSKTPVRADCVFVTVAHLLGTTPQEVSRRTNIPIPQPGDGGTPEMLTILSRLGLVFRVWTYGYLPQGGGGPIRNRPLHPGRPLYEAFPRASGMPRTMGVAYFLPGARGNIRPGENGEVTGHVVVCTNPGTPYARYIDYQADPNGRDITATMRNTRIFAYFSIDPSASTGDLISTQRPAMEQLEVEEEQSHPETQNGATQPERPTTTQQEADGPQGPAPDTSAPAEVDEEHLNLWASGQFRGLSCLAVISALSAYSQQNSRPGRSLPDVVLGARDKVSTNRDCERAHEMATQIQRPSTVQNGDDCSRFNRLEVDLRLGNSIGAGSSDEIILEIGQQKLVLASAPYKGNTYTKSVDLQKAFESGTVAVSDIKKFKLYSYSANQQYTVDSWEVAGVVFKGLCSGSSRIARIDKWTSIYQWLDRYGDTSLQELPTSIEEVISLTDWKWETEDEKTKTLEVQPPGQPDACTQFTSLEAHLELGNGISGGGTNDNIVITLGNATTTLAEAPWAGADERQMIDLTKAFNSKIVVVSAIDKFKLHSVEGKEQKGPDAWEIKSITFTGKCAGSPRKAEHKKYSELYKWVTRPESYDQQLRLGDWLWA